MYFTCPSLAVAVSSFCISTLKNLMSNWVGHIVQYFEIASETAGQRSSQIGMLSKMFNSSGRKASACSFKQVHSELWWVGSRSDAPLMRFCKYRQEACQALLHVQPLTKGVNQH
jgi:hypothetical protein